MSEHPTLFGFGNEKPAEDYPFEFTKHVFIGANPDDPDGYWNTREEAIINFAFQFSELATDAQSHFLFVRKAPACFQNKEFGGDIKYRMIGRFGLAKLKEKNT
jgi:hypothetical protein